MHHVYDRLSEVQFYKWLPHLNQNSPILILTKVKKKYYYPTFDN